MAGIVLQKIWGDMGSGWTRAVGLNTGRSNGDRGQKLRGDLTAGTNGRKQEADSRESSDLGRTDPTVIKRKTCMGI